MNDELLHCCVVDDEPLAARMIASYVEKTPFMQLVGVYGSAHEAVRTIMEGGVDVVYLDIRMPQLSGMEFARIVPAGVRIVFVTAYTDYALEAFKVGAADYLMKPVSYEEFTASALRIRDRMECRQGGPVADGRLLVKVDRGLVQLETDRIIVVEGLKDYVRIHLSDGSSVVTLSSMKGIEGHLPASDFLRIHRSFIVNVSYISRIDRQKVVAGGRDIPIGDSYRRAVTEYISRHG